MPKKKRNAGRKGRKKNDAETVKPKAAVAASVPATPAPTSATSSRSTSVAMSAAIEDAMRADTCATPPDIAEAALRDMSRDGYASDVAAIRKLQVEAGASLPPELMTGQTAGAGASAGPIFRLATDFASIVSFPEVMSGISPEGSLGWAILNLKSKPEDMAAEISVFVDVLEKHQDEQREVYGFQDVSIFQYLCRHRAQYIRAILRECASRGVRVDLAADEEGSRPPALQVLMYKDLVDMQTLLSETFVVELGICSEAQKDQFMKVTYCELTEPDEIAEFLDDLPDDGIIDVPLILGKHTLAYFVVLSENPALISAFFARFPHMLSFAGQEGKPFLMQEMAKRELFDCVPEAIVQNDGYKSLVWYVEHSYDNVSLVSVMHLYIEALKPLMAEVVSGRNKRIATILRDECGEVSSVEDTRQGDVLNILHAAVLANSVNVACEMIEKFPQLVHEANHRGLTPWIMAVDLVANKRVDSVAMLRVFIESGAVDIQKPIAYLNGLKALTVICDASGLDGAEDLMTMLLSREPAPDFVGAAPEGQLPITVFTQADPPWPQPLRIQVSEYAEMQFSSNREVRTSAISEFVIKLQAERKENQNLLRINTELRRIGGDAKQELEVLKRETAAAQEASTKLYRKEGQVSKRKITKLEKSVADLREEVKALSEENTRLHAKNRAHLETRAALEKELALVKADRVRVGKVHRDATSTWGKSKVAFEQQIKALRTQVGTLTEQVSGMEALKAQIADAKCQLATYEAQQKIDSEVVLSLLKQYRGAVAELDEARRQAHDLGVELNAATESLSVATPPSVSSASPDFLSRFEERVTEVAQLKVELKMANSTAEKAEAGSAKLRRQLLTQSAELRQIGPLQKRCDELLKRLKESHAMILSERAGFNAQIRQLSDRALRERLALENEVLQLKGVRPKRGTTPFASSSPPPLPPGHSPAP